MLSELKFLPASRGALQLLRRRLELVKRGKDILQMRRDQLAKELLSIMEYLRKRAEAEREFFEAARRVSLLRVVRGDYDFKSTASLVK
ncbi:MAG: V-type ATP synthase subunit D, partial [Thermofilum sp.]